MNNRLTARVSRLYMLALGIASLCFVVFGLYVFHVSRLVRSTAPDASWEQSSLMLLLMGVCFIGFGLYFAQGLIREVLQAGGSEVILEDSGIVITDKRGHRVSLDYRSVQKLRVANCGNWCGPALTIFTPRGVVRLSRWLPDASALRDTIVERAGLEKSAAGSWRQAEEYCRAN